MAHSLNSWLLTKEASRLIRFTLVGLLSTVVDFGLLIALVGPGRMPVLVANTISYSSGLAVSFFLHRLWTFSDARADTIWSQMARFLAVSLAALVVNNAIVWLLGVSIEPLLGLEEIGIVAAKAVATLVVLGWRFFANCRWTFRSAPAVYAEE